MEKQICFEQGAPLNKDQITFKLSDGCSRTYSLEFIEWFRGFSDAESYFSIGLKPGNSFNFKFSIEVHKDDLKSLIYIKDTLGFGRIKPSKSDSVILNVIAHKELKIIIAIFSRFNLNSTKHLNFVDFSKAFSLYYQKDQENRSVNKLSIENIKNNMNTKRICFTMPEDHQPFITANWLVGFVEGDGSFFFNHSNKALVFSIKQKGNYTLMLAIKDFIDTLANQKGINSNVKIYTNKDTFELIIFNLKFIELVIVPFFNTLTLQTKKYLDFVDWTLILDLLQKGFHYHLEGLALITRITNQMNNNRLSSPSGVKEDRTLLHAEVKKFLLNNPSNYELIGDKIWIKSLDKFRVVIKSVLLVEADTKKTINTFSSITECAKFLGLGRPLITERIRKGEQFWFQDKLVYLCFDNE